MNANQLRIKSLIKDIPDFPQKGIIFRDITTLLASPGGFDMMSSEVYDSIFGGEHRNLEFNKVVAIEARGFIVGAIASEITSASLVLARKSGKLPKEVFYKKYSSEYGENTLCIQTVDITNEDIVIVVDDVLATGGTAKTTCEIIQELGGEVEACYFLIELDGLNGRKQIEDMGIKVISSIHY